MVRGSVKRWSLRCCGGACVRARVQVAEGIKHMAGGQVRVVLSGQEVQVARA